MPRYIDAEPFDCISWKGIPDGYDDTFDSGVLYVADLIDEAPTVSPDEVRGNGKWILVDGIDEQAMARVHYIYCSKCGRQGLETRRGNDCRSNYCPHCGAKMEVSEDA